MLKHYTLIEVLSPEHGGLTRAAFRRSTALKALGEHVEVLCFNLVPDFTDLAKHVRENSEIGDVPLRNFFHALACSDEAINSLGAGHANLSASPQQFRPIDKLTVSDECFSTTTQSYRLRNYVDEKGTVTRVDFVDRDEKLFFVDERRANTGLPRRMTLVDRRTGRPVNQGGNYAFRLAWIDSLVANDETVLGIDAANIATVLKGYTRANVQKNYFIHALHMESGQDPIRGKIRADRIETFRSSRTLDNIICLTQSQAHHLVQRLDPSCAVRVLPNVIPPAIDNNADRDPNLCVIISRIEEGQKRLTVWLRAFAQAVETNQKLRADVFGGPLKGKSWDAVTRTIDELGLGEYVTFYGHTENAATQFSRAGFTVMTSREEGFGMTLVEAMRRGAIPISFDINYGPSEIITHGTDGYLIADGDVDAIAERMVRASHNGPEIRSMRDAAIRSSERFAPNVIGRAYLDIVRETRALAGDRRRLSEVQMSVERIVSDANGQAITVAGRWPAGDIPRLTGIELVATDHHTLLTQTVRADHVHERAGRIEATFTITPALFDGLGRKDVTGWVRLRCEPSANDIRPVWPEAWTARPGLSPSNRFNLR